MISRSLYTTCLFPGSTLDDEPLHMVQMVRSGSVIERELRYNYDDMNLDVRPLINIVSE